MLTYRRPITKKGFFRKGEYVYDETYDCCPCHADEILSYSTTNRKGYREYKSNPRDCAACPHLCMCTLSRDHRKIVTRHVWEDYTEICEDIRHSLGNKEIYQRRKETIERIFGTAKEMHGLRYTAMVGKARMEMKVGLTYLCMNLKKSAKMKKRYGFLGPLGGALLRFFAVLSLIMKTSGFRKHLLNPLCLRSDHRLCRRFLILFLPKADGEER